MRTVVIAASIIALTAAAADRAHANAFSGPYVGLEVALEDYDAAPDGEETFSIVGGWDTEIAPQWIVGASLRYTVDGAEAKETVLTPGAQIAVSDVAIEDQWSLSARAGRVLADRLLVFAEGGYEQFSVSAFRTIRNQACTPPSNCVVSRTDFSFDDELWTIGVGAEWAFTDTFTIRGAYAYGDSDAFERNRFSISATTRF